MASDAKAKKLTRKVSYASLQKLIAGVSLLCFLVILIAGLQADVRMITIAVRAMIVMLVIKVIARVVISVLATYEEMNSGEA